MVVRDILLMANPLTCIETCDVMMVQTTDEVKTDDSIVAALPSCSSESSQPLIGIEHAPDVSERNNHNHHQSLKVLTSMRGSHLAGSKLDTRRSEDDDGYCSRSSLDSPVQITKQDLILSGTEEADSCDSRPHSASKSSHQLISSDLLAVTSDCEENGQQSVDMDCLSGKEDIDNHESDSQNNKMPHEMSSLASLDHSYLLVNSMAVPSTNAAVTMSSASIGATSDQLDSSLIFDKASIQPLATILGGINKSLSTNRRNFSVYVVPRGIRSMGATNHCEAGLVQVAPVVSSRSLEASASRWNGRTGTYGDLRKDSSRKAIKKESTNGAVERPISLSWHVSNSVSSASLQDNSLCADSYVASLRTSLAHRPDQYKPGISTGRCRIGLSEISKRLNPVGTIAHQKGATSARTGSLYVRAPQASRSTSLNAASTRMVNRIAEAALRLHPLVDHDYGAFATFNAEIQSSIISTTTDGASQMDWRSMRKNRVGRIKNYRMETAVVSAASGDQSPQPKIGSETPPSLFQVRQKRKYCRKQPANRDAVAAGIPKVSKNSKIPGRKGRPPLSDSRRLAIAKKRSAVHDVLGTTNSSSQSFVKIPGHYQNEFVYYATKRTRGRPRKQVDANNSLQPGVELPAAALLKPSAGGICVFDWYREMAQTDKSSRFGTTASSLMSPQPTSVHWTSHSSTDTGTPADESAVADLVMEMLPKSELVIGKDFHPLPMSCEDVFSTTSNGFPTANDRTEMSVTEEDVCAAMLQSLNEADLKMIETQLGVTSESDTHRVTSLDGGLKALPSDGGDATFSPYLQDYSRDGLLSLSAASASNGLLDVDDINDSDLLTADLGNMNVLLSDLSTPTRDVRISNAPVVSRSNLSALFDLPSISSAEPRLSKEVHANGGVTVTSPPELTTVNMFWNDVPGLLINGLEYVRLVDIHRQMLPAKDTGILKKRCQMLMLDVLQCSELQRDFLIRYMYAAKSKSTAIVSRQHAIRLIGFYVNPKQKVARCDDNDISTEDTHSKNVNKDKPVSAQLTPCDKIRNSMDSTKLEKHVLSTCISSNLSAIPDESFNKIKQQTSSVSPKDLTGIKRSERLRDKHVRYADMVLGIHHRHGVEAEDETLESQFPRGNVESMDCGPLRAKSNHASCDVKVCDIVESNHGRSTSDSAKSATPSVQHCHRTRLASSSDHSAKATCETVDEVVQPRLQFNQNSNIVESAADSVALGKCDAMLSVTAKIDNRRVALQQRFNRVNGHRRRGVASLRRRVNLKGINVDGGAQHSLTSMHETSKACEDFKENLDAKGLVADNADIHRLTKDTAKVSETEAGTTISDEPVVSSESSYVEVDVVGCECSEIGIQPNDSVRLQPSASIKSEVTETLHWPHNNLVQVRHCDVLSRLGRRRRSQNGCVLLDRFTWKGAKCVRCDSCSELFSPAMFVSHMHRWSGSEELVAVRALQRLEPRRTNCEGWRALQGLHASFVDGCGNETSKCDKIASQLQPVSDPVTPYLVCSKASALGKLQDEAHRRLTLSVESTHNQEAVKMSSHNKLNESPSQNSSLSGDVTCIESKVCRALPSVISDRTSLALIRSKRAFPLVDVKQDVRGHLRPNFRRRSPGGARTARK